MRNNRLLEEEYYKIINNTQNHNNFTFKLKKSYIEIIFNKKVYKLTIIEENNDFFWKLAPYKKSYFQTKLKNRDAIFVAIHDDNIDIILQFKKNILKKDLENSKNLVNGATITCLLNEGYLDKFIEKLNEEPIVIKTKNFSKENVFNSYEHFLQVLDKYIDFYNSNFTFVMQKETILKIIFYTNDNDFFCSKKYIGNNDNIKYFLDKFAIFTIETFYKNYSKLSPLIKNELKKININMDNLDLKKTENKNKILNILVNFCIIAKKDLSILYLLKNMNTSNVPIKIYEYYWKDFIEIYSNNIQLLDVIANFNKTS